jgi:hypothetical protein
MRITGFASPAICAGRILRVCETVTTADSANWWSRRRFGLISLALSLAEVSIIYGLVAWIVLEKMQRTPPLIRSAADFAFLIGGLGSMGFAVAGSVDDSHRLTAFIAIWVSILTFLVCGLQMLV